MSRRGEKMTTIEELNYLKSLIEIRYRPSMVKNMIWIKSLSILSIISMLSSMILLVMSVNQSLDLVVISIGWFTMSLVIFFWVKRIRNRASKIVSLLDNISGLDDPSELDSMNPNDYGLEWKVEK